jgi:chromate transporter
VTLLELGRYFTLLSLLTFGGVSSVIPEMQRYIVDVKGWTTAADFMHLFAVAQSAPGPNVLFASLIGYRIAGVGGSLVALVGLCVPTAAGMLKTRVNPMWQLAGGAVLGGLLL